MQGKQTFCSKCGRQFRYAGGDWVKIGQHIYISSVTGKSTTLGIYGTSCCRAKAFSSLDIVWDYSDRPAQGRRVASKNLAELVKLCCSVGKSPFSIRKGITEYYFEVKSKQHKYCLDLAFGHSIKGAC